MQLKITRSQREGGIISKNVIFCLDARVEFTAQEQHSITRYKLQNQVIYNSEASARHLAKADAQRDGSIGGSLKSLASVALAAMRLNISIASLQRGQHVECKSLDELLGAEEAIMTACENLRGYLDTAASFDGREILIAFEAGGPTVIAHSGAAPPAPILPPSAALPPSADAPAALPPPAAEIPPPPATEEIYEPPAYTLAPSYLSGGESPFAFWAELTPQQRKLIIGAGLFILFLILVKCAGR